MTDGPEATTRSSESNEGTSAHWIRPVTLEGDSVRLEPLTAAHVDGLWAVADHPEIWTWMPYSLSSRERVAELVGVALEWPTRGWGQAFVQVETGGDSACGVTCYLNADPQHRRVEIGGTWITPAFQRTRVNTEAKLLLMRHAFEELEAIRVEWKTDSRNVRSRKAIARLGATEEGTLRNHMLRPDGSVRHSTYFSVIREEWPRIERRLEDLLARHRTDG